MSETPLAAHSFPKVTQRLSARGDHRGRRIDIPRVGRPPRWAPQRIRVDVSSSWGRRQTGGAAPVRAGIAKSVRVGLTCARAVGVALPPIELVPEDPVSTPPRTD